MSNATLRNGTSGFPRAQRYSAMSLALPLALLLILPTTPAAGGQVTWKVEPIDTPRGFGSLTHGALAVDGNGAMHLAYGGRHLYYAYRANGATAWRFETADDAPNAGSGAAVALDHAGRPHISYCADAGSGINHATRDAAGWQVETVYAPPKPEIAPAVDDLDQASQETAESPAAPEGGGGGASCATSLAVREDGTVHVAFHVAGSAHGLRYARRDAAGWHVSTLDPGDFAGGEPSLALDGKGIPHISYYGGYPHYDLRYAFLGASGWRIMSLSHGGDAGLYSSLAIDSHDRVHIAYYEAYTGDLVHLLLEGSQGDVEPVDTEGDTGLFTSLALDPDDRPTISYYTAEPVAAIKLAYMDADEWHSETLLEMASGSVLGDTALALTPAGVARVVYFNVTCQQLGLTWPDPAPGWQGEGVDRAGTAGDNSSLELDAQGYPHISYYAGYLRGGPFFGHLKHAWQDAAGWHDETLDAGGEIGRGSSLRIDGAGAVHISYLGSSGSGRVLYARNDSGPGAREVVADEAYQPGPTSLDLDPDGNPHISYVVANTLVCADRDDFGWHTEVVDQGMFASCDTPQASLALDTNGWPHIAYSLCSPLELRHAWQDEAGWHVEVVDSDGEAGRYNSLALSEEGWPRIAYYAGYPYYDLRYAWQDGDGWHSEVAFGGGDDGLYPSLVLDGAGQPVISFLSYLPDRSTMSLGVAQRVGMGWSIGVGLYTGIDTGPGTSLALDTAGLPMISFSGDGGLRVGRFVPWEMRYLPLVM